MNIKTVNAIKAFGSKAKACEVLGITPQNATKWGYYMPARYTEKAVAHLSTPVTEGQAMQNLTSLLESVKIHPSLVHGMTSAAEVAKEAVRIEEINRAKSLAILTEQDDIEVEGYSLCTDIDMPHKLISAHSAGREFYFYNHDEMIAHGWMSESVLIDHFKLYPIYEKAGE